MLEATGVSVQISEEDLAFQVADIQLATGIINATEVLDSGRILVVGPGPRYIIGPGPMCHMVLA